MKTDLEFRKKDDGQIVKEVRDKLGKVVSTEQEIWKRKTHQRISHTRHHQKHHQYPLQSRGTGTRDNNALSQETGNIRVDLHLLSFLQGQQIEALTKDDL